MNLTGLLISFAFIGAILATGIVMAKGKRVRPEAIRKFIHIGVSNWWFLLLWTFTDIRYAVIGPVFFIIANGAAVFSGAAGVLGIRERRRNYGLIYYPISLLVLVVASYAGLLPIWAAGMGFLTMGYGDGLAAVVGTLWKSKHPSVCVPEKTGKTIAGTVTMFCVTVFVLVMFSLGYRFEMIWMPVWWLAVLSVALGATVFEALTPCGLDNLTVPLGTAVLSALVFAA